MKRDCKLRSSLADSCTQCDFDEPIHEDDIRYYELYDESQPDYSSEFNVQTPAHEITQDSEDYQDFLMDDTEFCRMK